MEEACISNIATWLLVLPAPKGPKEEIARRGFRQP